VESIAISKDHANMVRYKSGKDNDYWKVSSYLQQLVHKAPMKVANAWKKWEKIKGLPLGWQY
jgi:hypothetical protein